MVVQGMFHVAATLQAPPVWTSGALEFGKLKAVNPLALPHQMKPRRSGLLSPPCPWISSDTRRVLDVPSVIWTSVTCGFPAAPYCWYLACLSLSGWAQP